MFIDIIRDSLHQLEAALAKRCEQLNYYKACIKYLPGSIEKYGPIYYLLIQASLFSENGISTQELIDASRSSRTTISNRLKFISEKNLLIKKTDGNVRFYSLNLETVDELAKKGFTT